MTTKKELFGVELQKYLTSTKEEKGIILDSLVRQTEMDRDSVIRAFRRLQLTTKNHTKCKPGRNVYYDNACAEALRFVWESANFCCGELLHPLTEERVKFAKEIGKWKFDKIATEKLLKISMPM